MNPIQKMEEHKKSYTETEQLIYQWIKDEPAKVIHFSIDDIAVESKTSKAAIVRFCKKIGYNGFAEFKFELSRFIVSGMHDDETNENVNIIKSITSLYGGFLRQFIEYISIENISYFVSEIKKANRVKIIGNNRTGLSAIQMRYRMSKIGFDAEAITDMALVQTIQDIVKDGDLIILFTIYAQSKVYTNFIKAIQSTGAKLILITMTEKSSYEKYSDLTFVLPCISRASTTSFLDDQALFFVFIEIVLAKLASKDENHEI